VITQEHFEVKQLSSAAAFTQTWLTLYRALYEAEAGFRYQGDPVAHRLYEQLISPLKTTLAEKERLVIVPDKELCYLPFEALIADLQAGHYLIQA
jgi:CHAT domain-containing protein